MIDILAARRKSCESCVNSILGSLDQYPGCTLGYITRKTCWETPDNFVMYVNARTYNISTDCDKCRWPGTVINFKDNIETSSCFCNNCPDYKRKPDLDFWVEIAS